MDDIKIHPSEMMEFASVGPEVTQTLPSTSDKARRWSHYTHDINDTRNEDDFDLYGHLAISDQDLPRIGSGALAANRSEHAMTFRAAIHLYPKAIGWSAIISLAIIMEGYDTALINSFYAFPEFERKYGEQLQNGSYSVSTQSQATMNNMSVLGAIIGLFANGILTERFGYRKTMIGALIALAFCIFPSFFAYNIQLLVAGQFLCGLSWGIFSTLTMTYAAEIMPLNLRGFLTSNVNLCWLLGQITALAILRALINLPSEWSYRIPFGLQWVWIVIILLATLFAPESPWWLIRNDRSEEAKKVLIRLTRRNQDFNPDNTISMMEHTNIVEQHLHRKISQTTGRWSKFSYVDCFRGPNLRRTEIACMIFMIQNCCGLPVISFAAYMYKQSGFDVYLSFDITLGMHGLAVLGAFCSLVLMKHFGRRTLYLWGLGLSFIILIAAGAVGTRTESPTVLWALAGLIMAFIFVFDATIGPLTYCIVAEIPSTRLRVKTVVLARVSYNVNAIITNILQQRMLNPAAWNWRAMSCFFWAGSCCLCIVYCYFRLPETYGLSFHELDILFEKKADARKFSNFQKILEQNGYFSFYEGAEGREIGHSATSTVAWH